MKCDTETESAYKTEDTQIKTKKSLTNEGTEKELESFKGMCIKNLLKLVVQFQRKKYALSRFFLLLF